MPRLSEYLELREGAAAQPRTQPAPDNTGFPRAHPFHSHQQQLPTAAPATDDALAAELARLQRQHATRLQQHGARVYRQEDGTLAGQPPPRDPYVVANRAKHHGLVQHCRQQPGVDQQLERTGVSARYNINTSPEQHAAAMAAIGLSPELDSSGAWDGLQPELTDPLTAASHALRHTSWRALTRAVLERGVAVHGISLLDKNSWSADLYSGD